MKPVVALAALLAIVPAGVSAQQAAPAGVLPTNTEVLVTLNDQLHSSRVHKGQLFDVSVSRDVMADGRIVIPRGTPGKGEIVYRTGKGAFGKSGKMEFVLRELDIEGRALPLTGRFRKEGQGNTGAVVGTVVLAGAIAGAFVTGHSAIIEQGREFKAFTAEAWPVRGAPLRFATVTPSAPIIASAASVAPGISAVDRVAIAPRDGYARALAAQKGVRGRYAPQGWTISD